PGEFLLGEATSSPGGAHELCCGFHTSNLAVRFQICNQNRQKPSVSPCHGRWRECTDCSGQPLRQGSTARSDRCEPGRRRTQRRASLRKLPPPLSRYPSSAEAAECPPTPAHRSEPRGLRPAR